MDGDTVTSKCVSSSSSQTLSLFLGLSFSRPLSKGIVTIPTSFKYIQRRNHTRTDVHINQHSDNSKQNTP